MIYPNDKTPSNNKKIEQVKKKQKNHNTNGNKSTKKSENFKDNQSTGSASSDPCEKTPRCKSAKDINEECIISPFTQKSLAPDTSDEILELVKDISNLLEKKSPFDEKALSSLTSDKKAETSFNKCNFSKSSPDKNEKPKLKSDEVSLKDIMKRSRNDSGMPPFESDRSPDIRKRLTLKDKKDKYIAEPIITNFIGDNRSKIQQRPNKPYVNERFEKISALKEIKDLGVDGYLTYAETPKRNEKPNSHKIKIQRPSEIPLWKNRTKFSRKAKHISLLMENPVKETESSLSLDFCLKKPCSPIEEVSICSEGQSEEKVTVKYRNQRKETPSTPDNSTNIKIPLEGKITEENIGDNVLLNRCTKISNIPLVSELSCYELTEKQSKTNHKPKLVDLEVVKSASATDLTDTGAFFGFDTFHQKKGLEGDKLEGGKKFNIPVFAALVGKSSKKNLSARLNCKENKQTPKSKAKKGRNDTLIQNSQVKENIKIEKQLLLAGKVSSVPGHETKKDFQGNEEANSVTVKKYLAKGKTSSKDTFKKSFSQEAGKKDRPNLSKERKPSAQTSEESDLESISPQKPFPLNEGFNDENNKLIKVPLPFTPPATPLDKNHQQATATMQNVEKKVQKLMPAEKSPKIHQNTSLKQEEGKRAEVKGKPATEKKNKDPKNTKNEKELPLSGVKLEDLTLKGTALSVFVNTPPNGSENNQKSNEAKPDSVNAFEWLYLNYKKCSEQLYKNVSNIPSHEAIQTVEEEEKESKPEPIKQKKEESAKTMLEKEHVEPEPIVSKKKKKVKSAPNEIHSPPTEDKLPQPPKEPKQEIQPSTQQRRPLNKASHQNLMTGRNEVFGVVKGLDLRRRTSEPGSFRGFLWKKAETDTPRGNKASVSSVASSLKHLNTDELEDFIFWEALPERMTACWEMSLYHLKRPWSVLSCAVFKYNRESSTPGIILSNLRRGSDKNIRQTVAKEKLPNHAKNSFDVEPSIAQKNIDIKNWLAALNFPTASPVPYDTVNEGDFSNQFANTESVATKSLIPAKQRKTISKSKFTDESVDKKQEDKKKFKETKKWDSGEMGSLKDLVRRKSGGFVTYEQFLNPETPTTTVANVCTYISAVPSDATAEEVEENSISLMAEVTERGEGATENDNENTVRVEGQMMNVKGNEVLKDEKNKTVDLGNKEQKTLSQPGTNTTTTNRLNFPTHPVYEVFKQILLLIGCMIGLFFILQFVDFDIDAYMS